MVNEFPQEFTAGWGDMDFNGHMRNTAFLDVSGTARMMYFESQGFSMREFERLKFGPVISRDEIAYFKEIRLLEVFSVSVELAGLSADGSRFRIRNAFVKADGKVAAIVLSSGGWLDLEQRRLASPPDELNTAMRNLARAAEYEDIPANIKVES